MYNVEQTQHIVLHNYESRHCWAVGRPPGLGIMTEDSLGGRGVRDGKFSGRVAEEEGKWFEGEKSGRL